MNSQSSQLNYKNELKNKFYYYYLSDSKTLTLEFEEYMNIYFDDLEMQNILVNMYELYGQHEKAIELLKQMEKKLEAKSNTHTFAYRENIGYQYYFYYKYKMNSEFSRIEKILQYNDIYKNKNKRGFFKEDWIYLDKKLIEGLCPASSDFLSLRKYLDEGDFDSIVTKPIMVYLRLHFDLIFYKDCYSFAETIRSGFRKENERFPNNLHIQAILNIMNADYLILSENKFIDGKKLLEATKNIALININAEWILQEIEYRNFKLKERSSDTEPRKND